MHLDGPSEIKWLCMAHETPPDFIHSMLIGCSRWKVVLRSRYDEIDRNGLKAAAIQPRHSLTVFVLNNTHVSLTQWIPFSRSLITLVIPPILASSLAPPLATSTPASTIILAIPTTSVAANHSVAPFASVTRFVGVPRSSH